jgi:hypothetical protein
MPSHNRHIRLARLLTVTCALAAVTAAIVATLPGPSHPPERTVVHAARVDAPANPSAVNAAIMFMSAATATTTSTTSTTAPPALPQAPLQQPAPPVPASEIEQIIARWFPGELYGQARRVAVCESTLNPSARSGPNYGLFQINRVHADDFVAVTGVSFDDGWSDPNLNAQYAAHLHAEQGWGPWSCKP